MNKNDLIITRRQASFLSAGLLILFTAFFIVGYIIGQRKALNEFNDRLQDESFSDRVRYSLNSSYGSSPMNEVDSSDSEVELDPQSSEAQQKQNKIYSAQLFGCGTLKAAQAFVNRVKKLGINTFIKEKKSKSAKGKIVRWYQLVTKDYDNKEDLQKDLDKIQITEKLQQIKIIEV